MPPLCPLELPAIRVVRILQNGHMAAEAAEVAAAADCERFQVSEDDVRRYFALTRRTNANDAHHTLDYSTCAAVGQVELEDGAVGRWSLSPARSGTLVVSGQEPMVLYCPECEFGPFR